MGSEQDSLLLLAGQYLCRGRFFFFSWLYFSAISQLQIVVFLSFFFPCLSTRPGRKGSLLSELPNWVTQAFHSSTAAAVQVVRVFVCLNMLASPPPPPHSARLPREWRRAKRAGVLPPRRPPVRSPWLGCGCVRLVTSASCVVSAVSQTLPLRPPQAWARRTTPS